MKRPTVMWQLIVSVLSVLLTIGVGWVSLTNQVKETATKQRIETDAMKEQIQEIKTSGDKKFDKIDGKMDDILEKINDLRVDVQNKQPRQ